MKKKYFFHYKKSCSLETNARETRKQHTRITGLTKLSLGARILKTIFSFSFLKCLLGISFVHSKVIPLHGASNCLFGQAIILKRPANKI